MFELAAAPGTYGRISTRKGLERNLPRSQTVDVVADIGRFDRMQRSACALERLDRGAGIEAIVADFLQSLGQDMLHEASKEFY